MQKKFLEKDGSPPNDEFPNHHRRLLYKGGEGEPRELATVGDFEGERSFSKHNLSRLLGQAVSTSPSDITESSIPGVDHAGIFFDPRRSTLPGAMPAALPVRRINVAEEETDNDSFHDSEDEDIYDLYNACNGIVRENGLLDIRELDELSQEDAEALNVARLNEIWAHTAAGCPTCDGIVRMLNSVRGALKANVEDEEKIDALDPNLIDSVS